MVTWCASRMSARSCYTAALLFAVAITVCPVGLAESGPAATNVAAPTGSDIDWP